MNKEILDLLLKEAKLAFKEDEIPVGSVIVQNGKIIASAHNIKQKTHIPTDHAEILAIKEACMRENDWRLENYELYVTLEPCDMCKEVIRQARIKKVYYLVPSEFNNEKNKNIEYIKADIDNEISNDYKCLLQSYFKEKR